MIGSLLFETFGEAVAAEDIEKTTVVVVALSVRKECYVLEPSC
jgi:hypothetical protein